MIQSKPFVSSLFVSVPTRSFGYGNCDILIRACVHALNPAVAATRLQNYPSTRATHDNRGGGKASLNFNKPPADVPF